MPPTKSPSAAGDRERVKRARLRFVRATAVALLIAAALLYIGAEALLPGHPWAGYAAAFGQAAMIGALADWFAVVALFRHPLGIPLPHTAIIPSNKHRIADNLGEFIQSRFLSPPKVIEAIRTFAPGRRLTRWLNRPDSVAHLGRLLTEALLRLAHVADDPRLRPFLIDVLQRQLSTIDGPAVIARILDMLSENRRHQILLDEALARLDAYLQHDDVRDTLVRAIARNIEFVPSTLNLDERVGRIILQRLYGALQTLLQDVRMDHHHVLRQRFDEAVFDLTRALREDGALRRDIQHLQGELVFHPETVTAMQHLFTQIRAWLLHDLQMPQGHLNRRVAEVAGDLGRMLASHRPTQDWIDEQILKLVPPVIERYRRTLGEFIAAQLKTWSDDFLVNQIELNIGRDLQFIRLNGTLVGGTVGLLIYAATQIWR
ncbi:MAG: DUF445 domain-containing protein [Gammaproteobacteria bacterium]|nr:DUF445 domain-containing protein [Gammaproteobacteria bacterium]